MEEIIAAQLAKFLAPPANVPVAVAAPPEQRQEAQLFQIGGRFRRAPEDFAFPSGEKRTIISFCHILIFASLVPTERLFGLWCLGDKERGVGPFKNFVREDMPTLSTKKRLSDVNNLMSRIEKKLKADAKWVASPTIAQVNEMFALAGDILEVADETARGRKRRMSQLKWNTHLDLLRKKERRDNEDSQEEEDQDD